MNTLFRSYCLYLFNKHLLITGCCSGLPQWLSSQESACSAGDSGDMGSIPRLGRSPGVGHGNLLLHYYLENPMDRGAQWAIVQGGHKELDITEVT